MAVPVTIDGVVREFLVEPGSSYSGIYEDVAAEMSLSEERLDSVQVYSDRGKHIDHYTVVPSLAIGSSTGSHLHFLLNPRGQNPPDIAGYMGIDVLKNFDLDFDFASMTLNLFSQDHCKGKVVDWAPDYAEISYKVSWGGRIEIPVTLEDTISSLFSTRQMTTLSSM